MNSTPLAAAVAALQGAGIEFALIGATAMSAHGAPRTTRDADLLVATTRVLQPELWRGMQSVDVRVGDEDDPLHGVVRLGTRRSRLPVDVVVPRGGWLAAVVERAAREGPRATLQGIEVPVVTLPDLVLLKADAGGYTDRQDILLILSTWPDRADAIAAHVESHLPAVSAWTRRVWDEVWVAWCSERKV